MNGKIIFRIEGKKVNDETTLTFDELREKYGFALGDEKDRFAMKILSEKVCREVFDYVDFDLDSVSIFYDVVREE